jgi:hypothetical protein
MKPGDFYVGVFESFSILLPGAALAASVVHVGWIDPAWLARPPFGSPAAQWVGFALAAYAAGHLVFLAASALDDTLYDPLRKSVWKDRPGDAYAVATALRERELRAGLASLECAAAMGGDRPMNTFSWAKSVLLLRWPSAAANVERYEADSKFFRSLVVVGVAISAIALAQGAVGAAVVIAGLAAACFWRYAERRYKSTLWAYRHVIVLLTATRAATQEQR